MHKRLAMLPFSIQVHRACRARCGSTLHPAWQAGGATRGPCPYDGHEAEGAISPCLALGLDVRGMLPGLRLPQDAVVHPSQINVHIQRVHCACNVFSRLPRHLPTHHCAHITAKVPQSSGPTATGTEQLQSCTVDAPTPEQG